MRSINPGEVIAAFVRRHGPTTFTEAELDAALAGGDVVYISRTVDDTGAEVLMLPRADAQARIDRDLRAEAAMRAAKVQA
jgi:hypothetical protein